LDNASTNDAFKRVRKSGPAEPSPVVFIRNLSYNATEDAVRAAFNTYGVRVVLLVLPKNQAFVELESVAAATAAIEEGKVHPMNISGQPVLLSYSNRKEVTLNPRYEGHGAAPSFQPGYSQPPPAHPDASSILLARVSDVRVPVTIDMLYQVFCIYGDVLRMVIFEKKAIQALVEFGSPAQATQALALDGREIFEGCNRLQVSFSKTPAPLRVAANNPNARDFTQPMHPRDSRGGGYPPSSGGYPPSSGGYPPSSGGYPPSSGGYHSSHGGYAPPRHEPHGYPPAPHHPSHGGYPPPHEPHGYPPSQGGYSDRGASYRPPRELGGEGCVLLVSKLPEEGITADMLFTIFGVYGDVMRVKIMFKNKSTGLVELATPDQAFRAKENLDGLPFFGVTLGVSFSRHPRVNVPPPDPSREPSVLTKDYTDSKVHRFIKPNSKNERHIAPPSNGICVSGIPEGFPVQDLVSKFTSLEVHVNDAEQLRLFGNGRRKMCVLYVGDIAQAVRAIIRLHNTPCQNSYLKLTFQHERNKR
jgi:hnRNP-L/PTB/hephaestus splicing factor